LLVVDGSTIVRLPYERTEGSLGEILHPLAIGSDGLEVEVDRLRVWRDIYYLGP